MSWELLGPSLVVLFELLVFGATIAFIYYFAREPEAVPETISEAASETGDHAEPTPATQPTTPEPERIPTPVA